MLGRAGPYLGAAVNPEPYRIASLNTHLATGVGATSPMDSDSLRDVQLLLQLLHNSHGSVLGLDDRHSTKLSTRAGHKPS